jgi:hypothetical protein
MCRAHLRSTIPVGILEVTSGSVQPQGWVESLEHGEHGIGFRSAAAEVATPRGKRGIFQR